MTEEFFNLDFEENYYDSFQHPFTSSRDSGTSSDDTHHKVQIQKKAINKKYEPIYENNILYRYEDNPDQYKKIRKKLQNRESANRVRGRQKNYLSDIQQELNDIKTENQSLQMQNAKLQAENVVLKQQLEFMQNLIIQQQQSNQSINPPLQIMERDKTKNKHLISLTAFTMILGFAFLNSQQQEGKEATVNATEISQSITNFNEKFTPLPYIFGSAITLWLLYAIYIGYKLFIKSNLIKKKII